MKAFSVAAAVAVALLAPAWGVASAQPTDSGWDDVCGALTGACQRTCPAEPAQALAAASALGRLREILADALGRPPVDPELCEGAAAVLAEVAGWTQPPDPATRQALEERVEGLGSLVTGPPRPREERDRVVGSWSLRAENDFLAVVGRDSDRFYTNGLKLRATFRMERDRWWLPIPDDGNLYWSVHLGQSIYSPSEICFDDASCDEPRQFATWLVEEFARDRPFTAWSYAGFGFDWFIPKVDLLWGRPVHIAVDASAGGQGDAGGEAIQRAWHQMFGLEDPNGWEHEEVVLSTRLGLLATGLIEADLFGDRLCRGSLCLRVSLGATAAAGNVFDTAGPTGAVRFGWHTTGLELDNGVIAKRNEDGLSVEPVPPADWALYFTVRGDARVIFYNATIERATAAPHEESPRRLLPEVSAGATVRWMPAQLFVGQIFRADELPDSPRPGMHKIFLMELALLYR